jgi:2-polyprenyl-3-methyl-5-hydroxy-6-metoxy-1,4-benzoquinol methylase
MIDRCIIDENHGSPRYFFRKNRIPVYICPTCGLIMADVGHHSHEYEDEDYYLVRFRTMQDIDGYWGYRWRHILGVIEEKTSPQSLLDVGAGNGYFVYLARKDFGIDAQGIDISRIHTEFAGRVLNTDIRLEALHEHSRRDYSAVTIFNVLEHVPDPVGMVQESRARLTDGGHIVITTPNPGGLAARRTGLKGWGMIEPPHHINLFTRVSLSAILTRNGLRPIHYETLSSYLSWPSTIASNDHPLRRMVFRTLRALNLGRDHFIVAVKD